LKKLNHMRCVDTSMFSHDECWGIQINGSKHCQNCKWTGISACEGQDIVKTGRNHFGYRIGENGLIAEDYDPACDRRKTMQEIKQ
jgi:hypothetical protein